MHKKSIKTAIKLFEDGVLLGYCEISALKNKSGGHLKVKHSKKNIFSRMFKMTCLYKLYQFLKESNRIF